MYPRKYKYHIGAIVIGGDFQGLGVVRSLGERGVPIFLVEHELSIGRYSRYVKRRTKGLPLFSNEDFTDYLIRLAKKEGLKGWVLFPNNDLVVKFLSLNRERLAEWYMNPAPPWETVRKFYFKKNIYDIAEGLSIAIPKIYRSKDLKGLISQDIEFPVVLKPSVGHHYFPKTKKKAVKVENKDRLVKEYHKMASIIDPSEIIVQEMIETVPGNLYSYATFFDGERSIAGLSARRWRQHPIVFGQATTYAQSVDLPVLKNLATKLLKELGYYGLAEVEFMKDEKDGFFKFLEINGRPWGWHTLAKAAGINLPYMQFQHLLGMKCDNCEPVLGVKWFRLLTDIPTVMSELKDGRLKFKTYLDSLKGKKEFAVFSTKDPLPFIMECIMAPYLWRKRGF